jgi:multiple sugar transport system permease protein
MTGATLSVLPLMAVFVIFQRHIIKGIALTGLKG